VKLSGGIEWALHCGVVLTAATAPVPVARLAELHDVSATYLAKQMQSLSRAGIVRSVQGQAGGYALARPAEEVSVLDVVEAVEGRGSTFVCTEIRQRGPLATPREACTRPCAITRAMAAADQAWRASLAAVTLRDLAGDVDTDYGVPVLPVVTGWLGGAVADGA
jgi:Rrf2 family protein